MGDEPGFCNRPDVIRIGLFKAKVLVVYISANFRLSYRRVNSTSAIRPLNTLYGPKFPYHLPSSRIFGRPQKHPPVTGGGLSFWRYLWRSGFDQWPKSRSDYGDVCFCLCRLGAIYCRYSGWLRGAGLVDHLDDICREPTPPALQRHLYSPSEASAHTVASPPGLLADRRVLCGGQSTLSASGSLAS